MPLSVYIAGIIAAVLVGLSKAGLPGVGLPGILLVVLAFPDEQAALAVGAVLPVLIVGDIFAVLWFRHHARWNRLFWLFPFVVVGMAPGWLVLRYVPDVILRVLIGVLVLLLIGGEYVRRHYSEGHIRHSWGLTATTGAIAGFCTMVAHAAGPVMTVYLVSQGFDKRQFIGTAAWFFFILNLAKVPMYVTAGNVTTASLEYDLVVAPFAVVGGLLGVVVLRHISQRLFDALALSLAALAAVWLIVDSVLI
jgi:hypothetical protein